eukprot:PhM_4_TR2708/c0_g2_i1/m.93525
MMLPHRHYLLLFLLISFPFAIYYDYTHLSSPNTYTNPPRQRQQQAHVTVVSHAPRQHPPPLDSARRFAIAKGQVDSIPWGRVLTANVHNECMRPPPFGTQCTVNASRAQDVCAAIAQCKAFVCPDTKEYTPGRVAPSLARLGIKGPVCLLREHIRATEKRHKMCRPHGCIIATKVNS